MKYSGDLTEIDLDKDGSLDFLISKVTNWQNRWFHDKLVVDNANLGGIYKLFQYLPVGIIHGPDKRGKIMSKGGTLSITLT